MSVSILRLKLDQLLKSVKTDKTSTGSLQHLKQEKHQQHHNAEPLPVSMVSKMERKVFPGERTYSCVHAFQCAYPVHAVRGRSWNLEKSIFGAEMVRPFARIHFKIKAEAWFLSKWLEGESKRSESHYRFVHWGEGMNQFIPRP